MAASDDDRLRGEPGLAGAVNRAEEILRTRWPAVETIAETLVVGVCKKEHQNLSGEFIRAASATAGQ